MSPEQASGERELDAHADIYSLGCVLYEMLVGHPPFAGATPQAALAARLTADPPSARSSRPELPAALEVALTRALARDPRDRFATATELGQALASAADRGDGQLPSVATRVMPGARAGRRPWIAAIALVLALGALLVGVRRTRLPPAAATTPGDPIPLAVLPFRTLGGSGQALSLGVGVPGRDHQPIGGRSTPAAAAHVSDPALRGSGRGSARGRSRSRGGLSPDRHRPGCRGPPAGECAAGAIGRRGAALGHPLRPPAAGPAHVAGLHRGAGEWGAGD